MTAPDVFESMAKAVGEIPERTVEIRGKSLVLSPLQALEIPAFARAVRPCLWALREVFGGEPDNGLPLIDSSQMPFPEITTTEEAGTTGRSKYDILIDLLADNGEDLITAIALGSRLPRDEVGYLYPDDLVSLATAVFEVNLDFFMTRMVPSLGAEMKGLVSRLNSALSPSGLSAADTGDGANTH